MKFYTDLHIHSKYSRATSKRSDLLNIWFWAAKKGVSVIGTGDFTYPAYFESIKENLISDDNSPGLFRLKPEIEKKLINDLPLSCRDSIKLPRFMLTVEISSIYKHKDKVRKIHNIIHTSSIKDAGKIRDKLDKIGNIKSDGRPILGLSARDLLEITLDNSKDGYVIPAHIWTPWFSLFGSKSGYDRLTDCYEDLSDNIFALETGLSSDPYMNWQISMLDKYRLVSNSDCHSPDKIGREATIFDCEIGFSDIKNALQTGNGYVGTVEFYPEEGKYHADGHRKCNVCLTPDETEKASGICPVCGKPVVIGVSYRVNELGDRPFGTNFKPNTAGEVVSLIPLKEIISEVVKVGVNSKKVNNIYESLIENLGPELDILTKIDIDKIKKQNDLVGEGISRLRAGNVIKKPGFDGQYGIISLFKNGEI